MNEKVRTIRLYGKMGAKFGRTHRLAVKNSREAMRALSALIPGFEEYMINAKDNGVTFAFFVGSRNIREDQLEHPVGNDDIRVAPILIGSKRQGTLQTILGIIVIIIGCFTIEFDGGATLTAGIGMTVGGVVQLLSPQPKGLGSRDKGENLSSYSFNGPVNVQAQGNPVPLLYGRLIVGSAVISAGIRAQDVYVPLSQRGYGYGSIPRWKERPIAADGLEP